MIEEVLKSENIASVVLRSDGRIEAVSDSMLSLLDSASEQVLSLHWQGLLVPDESSRELLEGALRSGLRIALPPLVLACAGGAPVLFGAVVIPVAHEVQETKSLLQIWPLQVDFELSPASDGTFDDTVAVIAADQIRYGTDWPIEQTQQLLEKISDRLVEIVRAGDRVGPVMASSIVFVLRDVDQEGAHDICRAVLSHLNGSVSEVSAARLCIGLSSGGSTQEALSTLSAAGKAAMLAQYDGAQEAIRFAQSDDHQLLLGQLLSVAGMLESRTSSLFVADSGGRVVEPAIPESVIDAPPLIPIETDIEGYVVDNMEGAVDQALFLARLDVPVGIVGSAGTGKMYIAKIIHEESGAQPESLLSIDCREFRSRTGAVKRIASELRNGAGKTLVFKSPHLMHVEAQQKLARQLSTRTLADVSPPRYLPVLKAIALFPEPLETLVQRGELAPALASAFAAYPIQVPPIRDRKQAVLRWAHKILGQEGALRDRPMKGFTPDAERAMQVYSWPGNISEMRSCIQDALERTDKDWLTPVDLGLYEGIEPEGLPESPETRAFLTLVEEVDTGQGSYEPTTIENLNVALGEAIHDMLALELVKPVGSWLEDDLVLATLDRYRQDIPKAAAFLQTNPRNIRRWLSKIHAREEDRANSSLWQKPRRLLRDWVRETPAPEQSPLVFLHDNLMLHLQRQGRQLSSAKRAKVMGVSTPTYQKRLRHLGGN